ncbi:sugar O-acetyltransferase [Colwellia sp. E2M01]|uniref:sugar O-acetyltransferase n=1 Tax=Colwellia sp. E2M01 TaxID=2841561 RepID=UPI001C0833F9|nr:sugar O-acetyltransferase [Colwellia sp. E2M01]MBU2871064.1 sugar O-acetyltransferase [Colwellia sp. E2M01]
MKIAFNSITPDLIAKRKSVHEVCNQFRRSPSKGNLKRVKALFQQCGDGVIIESGIHMDYGDNIIVGDRVYININCTMLDGVVTDNLTDDATSDNTPLITIGNDCLIGPNVQLLAVSHDVDPQLRRENKTNYVESITLDNNVWLSGGVIVLSGVTIGENSVIGAGSVVTKNVAANSFYAGNPAVKIRDL